MKIRQRLTQNAIVSIMAMGKKDENERIVNHFEVIFVLALQLILFPAYFYCSQLPENAYFAPFIILELLKHPPTVVFILFHLVIGCLFFRNWQWSSIDPTYGARFFICTISVTIMWQFATYDYNFYYDQAHYLDRLLLVILAVLVYCHPMFASLFTSFAIVVASQLHYPLADAAWLWPDKQILFDAMILFNAYLCLAAVRTVTPYTLLYLTLCLTAGIYFHAGVAKLSLEPAYYSWLIDNKLSNLFVSSYLAGWFGFLDAASIVALAKYFSPINFAMALGTLIIELSGIFILWSKRVSRLALSAYILLHVAIGFASGIFFWSWCVHGLALIRFVRKAGSDSSSIYNAKSFVLSLAIIFCANAYFRPIHFAWFDTKLSNFFTIHGTGSSGRSYQLAPHFFSPYDIIFCQSRFYYIQKEKVLVGTYGSSQNYWLSRRLEVINPLDIASLKDPYGESFYNEHLAKQLTTFLERYLKNAQRKAKKLVVLNYLGPPYHFGRSAVKNRYDFQEPLKEIQLYYEEHFFSGENILRVRKQLITRIPLIDRN